ncbi:uroporphyrinogen-III C-methyltransferase [Methanococcus maripaludis]|uniref:uroporphyrinogen-III C-methyltransferase n=1 Tax=Methanococcus maripaludis TaxID=39152 RepID=A0A2L1C7X0_METMI|nr:uroporphyrinogen-III C-methyltransferase [Methanococcus maripaludis]AVB75444.1 Uroporphyrinogen-III C-methyltransferase [Methanococcus maripaludis]MBA2863769.1 uroporphyrin-III C-methyltransferase [Methanococcus maripaludis]MBB6496225.1 uroporphyrin-III C-methyltransferase [Methanococcus maripaludis]
MKVILVGAGPGDEGLITLKGVEAIKNADVIVYDDLIGEKLLKYAKTGSELIYVGKRKGKHSYKQEEINEILIDKAKENKNVVRLKGGDSFVFGRGGEEVLALKKEGIEYEMIPGITSSISVPEIFGIPVTHRKVATSFTVVTGHEAGDKTEKEMQVKLSELNADTIVILMGITTLEKHVKELLKNPKRNENTPVAILMDGTRENQRIVKGNLSNIVEKAKLENVCPPGIIIVGNVVDVL